MKRSRRHVLQGAMLVALGLATPNPIVALAVTKSGQRKRYVLLELDDGRLLAVDLDHGLRVQLLSRRRAADGRYPLARSGALVVRDGTLASLEGEARATGWRLSSDSRGRIVVRDPQGTVALRLAAGGSRR